MMILLRSDFYSSLLQRPQPVTFSSSDPKVKKGMAKRFYVAKHGRKCGVFRSWEDCKAQVHGFPNALLKRFSTFEEAIEDWKRYCDEDRQGQRSRVIATTLELDRWSTFESLQNEGSSSGIGSSN